MVTAMCNETLYNFYVLCGLISQAQVTQKEELPPTDTDVGGEYVIFIVWLGRSVSFIHCYVHSCNQLVIEKLKCLVSCISVVTTNCFNS